MGGQSFIDYGPCYIHMETLDYCQRVWMHTTARDLVIGKALGGVKNYLGTNNFKIWQRILSRSGFKFALFLSPRQKTNSRLAPLDLRPPPLGSACDQ